MIQNKFILTIKFLLSIGIFITIISLIRSLIEKRRLNLIQKVMEIEK